MRKFRPNCDSQFVQVVKDYDFIFYLPSTLAMQSVHASHTTLLFIVICAHINDMKIFSNNIKIALVLFDALSSMLSLFFVRFSSA